MNPSNPHDIVHEQPVEPDTCCSLYVHKGRRQHTQQTTPKNNTRKDENRDVISGRYAKHVRAAESDLSMSQVETREYFTLLRGMVSRGRGKLFDIPLKLENSIVRFLYRVSGA